MRAKYRVYWGPLKANKIQNIWVRDLSYPRLVNSSTASAQIDLQYIHPPHKLKWYSNSDLLAADGHHQLHHIPMDALEGFAVAI